LLPPAARRTVASHKAWSTIRSIRRAGRRREPGERIERSNRPELLSNLPTPSAHEVFATLLERPGVRIERIVSHGHVTPANSPFEQDDDEWVMLVEGAARLWLDGTGEVELARGDHLFIPAGLRHRVTWTTTERVTVWLAVHIAPDRTR
jgi:cupin 2 domain-containing protein